MVMRRYAGALRAYDLALALAPDLHRAAVRRGLTFVLWQGRLDTLRAVLGRLPREADLGPIGTTIAQRAELLFWERHADSLLQLATTAPLAPFDVQNFLLPPALYAAWAHQLRGNEPMARVAFEAALVVLDSVLRALPDDWRVHAGRGLALAGLGRRDQALRESHWLEQSVVYREDAYDGASLLGPARAQVLAQAGEADAALDEIERRLAGPSLLSVHTLRLDPRWDPIREHPRFRALLAKYEVR
jgi:serine/threonine-protein kinase